MEIGDAINLDFKREPKVAIAVKKGPRFIFGYARKHSKLNRIHQ